MYDPAFVIHYMILTSKMLTAVDISAVIRNGEANTYTSKFPV